MPGRDIENPEQEKQEKRFYRLIYADPPWEYRNKRTGGSMVSGSAYQYPVLTPENVCALDVESITDPEGCVCFLWATVPLLDECIEVLHRWGFTYKTALFWVKTGRIGLGFWFRNNVEVLLMGVRGKVKPFGLAVRNHFEYPPTKHSAKPHEFYELLERTGLSPRVELFARNAREGWDHHGIEMPSGPNRVLVSFRLPFRSP